MLNQIDLSRVDLNLLVLFETVMEERHVGRAAQRLHLTPSAVSHGIGRLRQTFNDPLFLKHPKGVVPTERATKLAAPIATVLAQLREIVGTAEAFDSRTSKRRFKIGAPDAIAAVALPPVLRHIANVAPGIDIGVREMQPNDTLGALDAHEVDIALYPLADLPARFESRALFEEDFVIAARADHPIGKRPSIQVYCAARHLLVSRTADPHGFVDIALEAQGHSRRIVLTVPSFMWALAVLADGDLIGTLPRSLVNLHAARYGLKAIEPPFSLSRFQIRAIAPRAAMSDAGIAWLMAVFEAVVPRTAGAKRRRRVS
jgi:DNA-binding transcriptional LysR family regulator